MVEVDIYKTAVQYDPTHTTALRNIFAREMKKRFTELIYVIKESVVNNDCFGLQRDKVQVLQVTPVGREAFAFARNQQKLEAFMQWLQEQVNKGILSVGEMKQIGLGIEKAWTDLYILDSYKRGVIRARMEMINAGYDVPRIDETGGIIASMSTPFHIDRLGLLFTRVYNELKGITDAMDMQISRILAQGLADGDGPRLIARKLLATINGDGVDRLGIRDSLGRFIPGQMRAEMLARTEIIRAHHVATIQEYRNWGIVGVHVVAEFRTAGDDRVCPECEKLEGKIYTLDEAEGIIPRHPRCRCIMLPMLKE